MKSNRGTVVLEVLLAIALIGGAWLAFKPKSHDGDSRRADQSQQTTEALIVAQDKRGSVASAYNQKSSEVIGLLPNTPEKSFLEQASQIMGANLPAPDQTALIQAERLKVAVLEGRLKDSQELYEKAIGESSKLSKDLAVAISEKRASDSRLQEVAALRLGAERQRNQIMIVAGALAILWIWTKSTHFSRSAIGEAVADIRKGVDPIVAIDGVATRFQQKLVSRAAKLKS